MTAATAPNAFDVALGLLYPEAAPGATDPAGWVRDRLGEFLWSKQVEILEAVRDHRRVAVHSCHGSGKSFSAARVAAWWVETHPPGQAIVVSTAPTGDQVRGILWQEIGAAHRKGNLRGRVNQSNWWVDDTVLAGIGRKPADYGGSDDQPPQTFQGYHRRYMLVILDEAGGVPEWLWEAAGKLLTNDDSRLLAIGNPNHEGSRFSKVCSPDSGWRVIHIDGLATPNFTGEAVPEEMRSVLLGQTYIDELVADYGEESPQYLSQVRGLFPKDAATGVVPWSAVQSCRGPEATERIGGLRVPVELGVDVGAGADRTVIRARRGMRAAEVWRLSSDDPEVVADAVVAAIEESGATSVKVDAIGIGWATVGLVRTKLGRLRDSVAVHPVNVAEGSRAVNAQGKPRFVNLRAEIWWEVGRVLSMKRRWDLNECDDRTIADLTAPRWAEDRLGRIQVEAKDEIRKRLRRSTDDADALLLAFYDPPLVEAETSTWDSHAALAGRR